MGSERYYQEKIYTLHDPKKDCENMITLYPSVENYFFCGAIFENISDTNTAIYFYKLGLIKLPNIWDKNSPYWNIFFVKKTIT
jgi:hypothetical protein